MKFWRDIEGSTGIEFALLAVPLFAFLLAIAEFGFDLYCTSSLEVAARQAARKIQVGYVQQNNLNKDGFGSMVCGYLPAFMACRGLFFSVQTVSTSFLDLTSSSVDQFGIAQYAIKKPSMDQDGNIFCPGPSNSYVVVQFLYVVPVISGIWLTSSVKLDGRSVRVVSATEVFRNESFTASNSGAGC